MTTRNRRFYIAGASDQNDRARPTGRAWRSVLAAALLLAAGLLAPAAPAQAAGTIAVNTTADEYGAGAACSLREAVRTANDGANFGGCVLSGTPPFTINLPAGIYQLTIIPDATNDDNDSGDLDFLVSGTALVGAGAASTTIQQTTVDRVIDFNPLVTGSFSGSLSNLRITGGNTNSPFGGGGIIAGDSNGVGTVTLNGVTVDGNTASAGAGGGISFASRGNLVITNSTIANNAATATGNGQGGGIFFLAQGPEHLTISNSTISGNRAARAASDAGGGLHVSAIGGTITIQRTHFVNNQAADGALVASGFGGGIAHVSGVMTVSFSRFVGNIGANGSGIWQSAGGGTTTANDNWWGVNSGPGAGVLAGTPAPTATRWLQLRHSANPSAVPTTTSTTLTADLLGLNTGGSTAAANLSGLPPFPQPAGAIFSNPVLGTLSGAATQFSDGQATATYTAGATPGSGSADATADSQTVTANFTVPLAVLLASFSAEGQADRVLVRWDTVSEMGNLGFNLWRGESPDEPDRQLNAGLIPSQAPGSTQGFSYQWIDQADLVPGATYYYWLDDVDVNGVLTRHGPVSATLVTPTAVTLGGLSANPAAAAAVSWGLPALLTALGAAAALAWRRR